MTNDIDISNAARHKEDLISHLSALGVLHCAVAKAPLFDINKQGRTLELVSLLEMMQLDTTLNAKTKTLINRALESIGAV